MTCSKMLPLGTPCNHSNIFFKLMFLIINTPHIVPQIELYPNEIDHPRQQTFQPIFMFLGEQQSIDSISTL